MTSSRVSHPEQSVNRRNSERRRRNELRGAPTGLFPGECVQNTTILFRGLAADFDDADINDARNVDLPPVGAAVQTCAGEKIDFFGAVRGRIGGLVTDDLLLFATGGPACATVQHDGIINEVFNPPLIDWQFIAMARY
jgi:hypothetical protein